MSWPKTLTRPEVLLTSDVMMPIAVVLPAPFGPRYGAADSPTPDDQAVGAMFAFRRNRLPGSYLFFTATRRSWLRR